MKVTSVNLQRTIPTGAYENIKIGAEATVDIGETPEDAIKKLSDTLKDCYNSLNLEEMRGTTEKIVHTDTPKDREQSLIDLIKSCTVFEKPFGLDAYTLLVKNKPEAQAAYDEIYKKLKP